VSVNLDGHGETVNRRRTNRDAGCGVRCAPSCRLPTTLFNSFNAATSGFSVRVGYSVCLGRGMYAGSSFCTFLVCPNVASEILMPRSNTTTLTQPGSIMCQWPGNQSLAQSVSNTS
jgi:hypothetical protein